MKKKNNYTKPNLHGIKCRAYNGSRKDAKLVTAAVVVAAAATNQPCIKDVKIHSDQWTDEEAAAAQHVQLLHLSRVSINFE